MIQDPHSVHFGACAGQASVRAGSPDATSPWPVLGQLLLGWQASLPNGNCLWRKSLALRDAWTGGLGRGSRAIARQRPSDEQQVFYSQDIPFASRRTQMPGIQKLL